MTCDCKRPIDFTGNKVIIDVYLIPKFKNNIIVKKLEKIHIKNGSIKINEFPKKINQISYLLIMILYLLKLNY